MPIRVSHPTFPVVEGVVELDVARGKQRVQRYRGRIETVLEDTRRALTRLHDTGMLFTRHGSRVGRELLVAQGHLLKASDLMAREARLEGAGPDTEALLDEVEALLDKTTAIARRHKALFQRG